MRGCIKLNSKCEGWYWVDDDPGYWQHVVGRVIGISRKVYADNLGVGYIMCKVRIPTAEGVKIAYVLQSSKKCSCEKGAMSFLNSSVGRLPKLRDCRIIGDCSRKVYVI